MRHNQKNPKWRIKQYDQSMFKAKRQILGISRKKLSRETYLADETLRKMERGKQVWRSTELLVGLVLDEIAERQGQMKDMEWIEENWHDPEFRASFTQPLVEE